MQPLAVSVIDRHDMMGNLFNKYFLSEYVNAYRKSLLDKIDKLEITESTNIPSLVDRLKEEFTIFPIEIGEPKPSEPKETKRTRQNYWGESYEQKVFEIYVTIPFDGNSDLFYCSPSTSTVVYLDKNATINKTSVTATIVLEQLDENSYFSQINKIVGTLKTNLPRVHAEIKPWNDGLENLIKQSLESRKGIVSKV